MTTTTLIAKAAFDAVAGQITDAIKAATLNDGATDYTGRVVFTGQKAAGGFPMSTAKDRVNEAALEGFGTVPSAGWTLVAGGVTYFVLGVRDIVDAGGLILARVISEADMLWQSVSFVRSVRTDDGAGGWTEADTTLGATTGGMVAMSGSERWASMRVEATAKWRLIVRDTGLGLLASDRVTIDGRSYGISFIDDHEKRGEWLTLDLIEGAAT